jgi:SAM-dependent methyltransferase
MTDLRTADSAPAQSSPDVVARERTYWEAHEDLDWVSDASRAEAAALMPPIGGDVLEICIGSGTLTRGLAAASSASYTGVDLSGNLLRTLRRRVPGVWPVQADAHRLVFADGSFDTALVFSGLHHLPRYPAALEEIFRVLRPDGSFVCFEPNSRAWYRVFIRRMRGLVGFYSDDEVDLDPRDVADALVAAGFVIEGITYLTIRFRPGYLRWHNRILAGLMYAAAAVGPAGRTRPFFALEARKPD